MLLVDEEGKRSRLFSTAVHRWWTIRLLSEIQSVRGLVEQSRPKLKPDEKKIDGLWQNSEFKHGRDGIYIVRHFY